MGWLNEDTDDRAWRSAILNEAWSDEARKAAAEARKRKGGLSPAQKAFGTGAIGMEQIRAANTLPAIAAKADVAKQNAWLEKEHAAVAKGNPRSASAAAAAAYKKGGSRAGELAKGEDGFWEARIADIMDARGASRDEAMDVMVSFKVLPNEYRSKTKGRKNAGADKIRAYRDQLLNG